MSLSTIVDGNILFSSSNNSIALAHRKHLYNSSDSEKEKNVFPFGRVNVSVATENGIEFQVLGNVQWNDSYWAMVPYDGILGIAMDGRQNSYWNTLEKTNTDDKWQLTLDGSRLAEQSILLGSMNESAVVEPIRKTKCLDGLKTWNIPIVTMMVDTWTAMDDRAGIVPQAMLDSTSPYIQVENSVYDSLIDKITQGYSCERTAENGRKCDCPDGIGKFPNISIDVFDKNSAFVHYLLIMPQDYVDVVAKNCFPAVRPMAWIDQDQNEWKHVQVVLGMPFFRAYTTTLDFKHKEINIARSSNPVYFGQPEDRKYYKTNIWIQLGLAIIGGGLCYLFFLFIRKYLARLQSTNSTDKPTPNMANEEDKVDDNATLLKADAVPFSCPTCDVAIDIDAEYTHVLCEGCDTEYSVS